MTDRDDITREDLKSWKIDEGCQPLAMIVSDEDEALALIDGYVQNLNRRYALVCTGDIKDEVWDMAANKGLPVSKFIRRFSTSANTVNWYGEQGGKHKVTAAQAWLNGDDKIEIEAFDMFPGDERLISENKRTGEMVYNTWRRPDFGVVPDEDTIDEAAQLFEAFLRHLVPGEERERDWARNWIARKLQHPEERGVAFVHITETKGTGRGALINLMERLVGFEYHRSLTADDVYGRSSSSGYADMRGCLLMTCPEIFSTPADRNTGEARARQLISSTVEPFANNPKGQKQVNSLAYHSTFLAANDPHRAVLINRSERRYCIIGGPAQKLDHNKTAYAAINALMPNDHSDHVAQDRGEALIAGLYEYLMSIETCPALFKEVLDTPAYRELINGGQGPVDVALRETLEAINDDIDGRTLDHIVAGVKLRLEGKPPASLKSIIEEALTSKFALPDGTVKRGCEGWVLLPRQTRVVPPEGVKFAKQSGFGPVKADDPDGYWRITGLAVRERYAETYEEVTEHRGEIVSEMEGMTLDKNGKVPLKVLAGGRK